jgi:hypothetical protein
VGKAVPFSSLVACLGDFRGKKRRLRRDLGGEIERKSRENGRLLRSDPKEKKYVWKCKFL